MDMKQKSNSKWVKALCVFLSLLIRTLTFSFVQRPMVKTFAEAMSDFTEKECYIRNLKNGLYLYVDGGNTAPGTNVLLWTSNQSNAQKWVVQRITNGKYVVRSKLSLDRVLHIQRNQYVVGSNVDISSGSTLNEPKYLTGDLHWTLHFNNDGTVCFESYTGHYLDASNGGMTVGTNVIQSDYNGNPSMRWILETTLSAVNTSSDNCVDSGGHIDWDGSTQYSQFLTSAMSKWNSYIGYNLFRKDTGSTVQDLKVLDVNDTSDLFFGRYIHKSIGTDELLFNICCMNLLHDNNSYVADLQKEAVAAHELGHSLGLDHKNTFADVMTTKTYVSYTYPSINDMLSYAEASTNY